MKYLSLAFVFALTVSNAFALDEHFVCSYSKGQIFSRTTGQRVARSFNPRVVAGANRLQAETTASTLYLQDIFNPRADQRGYADCQESSQREGFDCYRVVPTRGQFPFEVFVGNQGQRKMVLVMALNTPGGATQEDEYVCNR